ncbi:MAG: PDZ domain-containing protein [Phycisphaeraceae bacterium]|nr:PDZ domain-containing protein [Phycisphaeraceae bacterium]
MPLHRTALIVVLLVAPLFPATLRAQDEPPSAPREVLEAEQRREEARDAERRGVAAFEARDLGAARTFFERQLELDPDNFVPMYNLACVLSLQDEVEASLGYLTRAIGHGFIDYRQLTSDPGLSNVRTSDTYRAIVEAWPTIIDENARAHFELIQQRYGARYLYVRDESWRIAYASAYPSQTLDEVRDEIERVTDWALDNLFEDLRDPPMRHVDPWVVVVLPNERDFRAWAVSHFGVSAIASEFHRIGGSYSHDRKELVAMDLGGTLRHEFLHVLHWRSNARAGQVHPIWIQEGLCSLVEDYDLTPSGQVRLAPSWRTNMIKRLEGSGHLPEIEYIARLPRDRFSGGSPLANYAMARGVFLFLDSKGLLATWYRDFVDRFGEDPSGVASLEHVLDLPIDEINREFRDWLRALPAVAEARADGTITGLDASLGVQVDPGSGEGPVVLSLASREARRAGLRPRDTIIRIDGRPTRDMNEFVRVMGDYHPGQAVRVDVRRRNERVSLEVILEPYR